jgi:hypothetical protein
VCSFQPLDKDRELCQTQLVDVRKSLHHANNAKEVKLVDHVARHRHCRHHAPAMHGQVVAKEIKQPTCTVGRGGTAAYFPSKSTVFALVYSCCKRQCTSSVLGRQSEFAKNKRQIFSSPAPRHSAGPSVFLHTQSLSIVCIHGLFILLLVYHCFLSLLR